jgi:tetratricopeptide (TPR) repeat protein
MTGAGTRARPAWAALAAAACAFLVYLPSFAHGWVALDDPMFLLDQTGWRGLLPANIAWDFTAGVGGVYQPLAWLTYGLDHALWGMDARGYHLQSALWHALAAGLFFFVARRVLAAGAPRRPGEPEWPLDASALAAALFFGLHPLRVESVAWASERRDVVCGALFIASVLSYLRAREPGLPARSIAPSLVLFLLALLAKGMAVTLPLVLLILDAYPLRRADRSAALREKLPFFALSAAFALGGMSIQHRLRWSYAQHGLAARMAQTAYALFFYARKTVWPVGLLPMYELRPPLDPFEPRFVVAAVAVIATVWLCWRLRRERPWAATAFAVYAVMLAPVCGFFQFGPQLVADRYSYLACLPFALLAGAALRRAPFVAMGSVVVLSVAAVAQQAHWKDSGALWDRVLAGDPGSGIAQAGAGRVAVDAGRLDDAEHHFRAALAAFPLCAEDQDRLAAVIAGAAVDPAEEARLRASVETQPVCRNARANLGAVLAQRGDLLQAERVLKIIAKVAPDDQGAALNLARVESLLRSRPQPR